MKLVNAVENTVKKPVKPISGAKKVVRFSPNPSNIIATGIIMLIIHFPPSSVLGM